MRTHTCPHFRLQTFSLALTNTSPSQAGEWPGKYYEIEGRSKEEEIETLSKIFEETVKVSRNCHFTRSTMANTHPRTLGSRTAWRSGLTTT